MLKSITVKKTVALFLFSLLIAAINASDVKAQSGEYGSGLLEQVVTQLIDARSLGELDYMEDEIFNKLINSILAEYESALSVESAPDPVEEIESENNGAEIQMIPHNDPVCRIIGTDVLSGRPITSCFWGHKVDATNFDKNGNEITNVKIVAFEELYFGGTYTDGVYDLNGEFIGKYRKFFKYNDNANVFWKIEVGLNGSTLEFCFMRDQEYSDTARTKEVCESLNIDIQ